VTRALAHSSNSNLPVRGRDLSDPITRAELESAEIPVIRLMRRVTTSTVLPRRHQPHDRTRERETVEHPTAAAARAVSEEAHAARVHELVQRGASVGGSESQRGSVARRRPAGFEWADIRTLSRRRFHAERQSACRAIGS
jgi:hypothetical protein